MENPFDVNADAGDPFLYEFLNMLSTLALIVLGLLAVAWIVRRFNQSKLDEVNATSTLKILERRPLSPKTVLFLVEVEGTALVFTEHATGITKLAEFELQPPA